VTISFYPDGEFRVLRSYIYELRLYQQYAILPIFSFNTFSFIFAPPGYPLGYAAINIVFADFFLDWNSQYWPMHKIIESAELIVLPSDPPVAWDIILEWNIAPTDTWGYLDFRYVGHPQTYPTHIEIDGAPDTYWLPGAP